MYLAVWLGVGEDVLRSSRVSISVPQSFWLKRSSVLVFLGVPSAMDGRSFCLQALQEALVSTATVEEATQETMERSALAETHVVDAIEEVCSELYDQLTEATSAAHQAAKRARKHADKVHNLIHVCLDNLRPLSMCPTSSRLAEKVNGVIQAFHDSTEAERMALGFQ